MRTGLEHLKELLRELDNVPSLKLVLIAIREAMVKDWHLLYHEAAWEDGCPICDKERASE